MERATYKNITILCRSGRFCVGSRSFATLARATAYVDSLGGA